MDKPSVVKSVEGSSRSRSPNFAACVLLLAFIAGGIRGLTGQSARESRAGTQAVENVARSGEQVKAQMRAEMERTGSISHESRANAVRELDAQLAAGSQGSHEAALLMRAQRRWLAQANLRMTALEQANEAVCAAPGVTDLSFTSKQDLEKLIGLTDQAVAAATENRALWRGLRVTVTDLMRQEGVDQAEIDGFLSGAERKLPLLLQMRDLEVRQTSATREQFQILLAQWGHWSVESDGVSFENELAAGRFTKLFEEIETISGEIDRLNAELVR